MPIEKATAASFRVKMLYNQSGWQGGVAMTKEERIRLRLIREALYPIKIYEAEFAVVSKDEWAANITIAGGHDRRFRFTHGKLLDEATISDKRPFA